MSVLGQHAFRLPGSYQTDATTVSDPTGVRQALLASRTLVGHPELETLWQRIFEPTAFLVGVSDDYTPFELAEVVKNLSLRDHEKGLSTGEKQMFGRAKKILASELMYAQDKEEDEATEFLDNLLDEVARKRLDEEDGESTKGALAT